MRIVDLLNELKTVARSEVGETLDLQEVQSEVEASLEDMQTALQEAGLEPLSEDGLVYDRFQVMAHQEREGPVSEEVPDTAEEGIVLDLGERSVARYACHACGAEYWSDPDSPWDCPECDSSDVELPEDARVVAWDEANVRFEEVS